MPERITSRANPLIGEVRRLSASGAFRRERGLFVCDSPKLLQEALHWSAPVETVLYTDSFSLPPVPPDVRCVLVSGDLMAYASPMKTPQGVLFTCRFSDTALPEQLTGRHYVVLDGVQDPGNVGTVLRTLDAFEGDGLLLLPGCADVFSPKAVRSSMGAVFRRHVWKCTVEELAALLARSDLPLYGTALRHDTVDVRQVSLDRCGIAIGSEGRGLSEAVLALCRSALRIPMSQRCESLNAAVAAAVVLWEAYR